MRRSPFLLPAALLLAAAPAAADEILLRNGRTLEGTVTEAGDTVVWERPGIRMEIRREEVKEVRRTPTPREEFAAKVAALAAVEEGERRPSAEALAESRHRLGLWCAGRGLKAEAAEQQERALALDPEHAGARRALGYLRVEGKWRLEEEVMRERGLLSVGGRWVTPEEAARIAAGEVSPREKERQERKARERAQRRALNAALARVADPDPRVRVRGEAELASVARAMGEPELEARAPEVRAYYDRFHEEVARARALVEVRTQLVTLKRPIPTFTTSLGAFSSPVTLQLPELSVVSVNTTAVLPLRVDEEE